MKKKLVALLLVLAVVSVGLFAALTDSFNVQAAVQGHHEMKFTNKAIANKGAYNNTDNDWVKPADANVLVGTHITPSEGATTFSTFGAFITAMSNSRAGFTVTMKATPMKDSSDQTRLIHYKVAVNKGIAGEFILDTNTDGAGTTGVEVMDTTVGIQGLTIISKEISIAVDKAAYEGAVEGTYTGLVTFTMSAK